MKKSIVLALCLSLIATVALALAASHYNSSEASSQDVLNVYTTCAGPSPTTFQKWNCACTTDFLTTLANTAITPAVTTACDTFAGANGSNTAWYTTSTPYTVSGHNALATEKLYNDSFASWTRAYPTSPVAKRQVAASCVADGYRASQSPFTFNRACAVFAGLIAGP